MKAIVLAASALMVAYLVPPAQAAEKSWFMPQLTAGDPAECAPLLAGARAYFAGQDSSHYPEPLGPAAPGLRAVSYDVEDMGTKPADIEGYELKMDTVTGCGSSCDTGTVTVLAKGKALFTTPEANPWAEYSDGKSRDFLVGMVDRQIEAYRVAAKPALACRIAMEPDLKNATDGDVLAALKAVDSLNQASLGMSRAGGNYCGSIATSFRWEARVEQALHQTLYRPWSLTSKDDKSSANSYGDYDRISVQLWQWSLGGFSQHSSFQQYKDRIAATEKILAEFYVERFGWQAAKAKQMAHSAVVHAISSGFGFYMYTPFENDAEEKLRVALFARAPMTDIRAIPLNVKTLDAAIAKQFPEIAKDSILNIAISYPEALQYLLDKGFDPNRVNPFGKTPLMYAAQYNQLEAARILLKAGADPNARTTRPPYECGYTLSTTGMTPLHYAARNAGSDLIRLLLKSGAVTFIKSHKTDGRNERDDAPIDWLRLYTKTEPGKERNPNLTAQEASALEGELAPPNVSALAGIAAAQVLLAEKQSAVGHDEAAYQAVAVALQADQDNQKALADLPLLALKTGRPGEAAQAATRATSTLKSDAAKASAWFNLGLVCQQNTRSLIFDGKNYCRSEFIEPFLRAWLLAPSDSREKKLVQMMELGAIPNWADFCNLQGRAYRVMFAEQISHNLARIYVLHPAGETVDPNSIGWTMHWDGKPATFLSPKPVQRHKLGSRELTVLESTQWSPPLMVNGQACTMATH